jgi:phosphoribosylanthranilate isomerase
MTRVKICGITNTEDMLTAVEAGADALGFNFWPGSPRCVEPSEAASIIQAVPSQIWTVGVFVDERPERVLEIAAQTRLSVVQLHGSESPEIWERLSSLPRMKAFKVGPAFDVSELARYPSATAFLLDAAVPGMVGGTGRTFDWRKAEEAKRFGNILLAGGLTAGNVAEAIIRVQPWGVDVCSGVESSPRKKSARLMREFIERVREAQADIEKKSSLNFR